MNSIDFNKVIAYSKTMCTQFSQSLCATYVKKAFERGGCKYMTGNGWDNQKWCEENGFKLIGDFIPKGRNPRTGGNVGLNGLQFPTGYTQQTGDVCLIKHGTYGHICYAIGPGLNDWVSDFFQRPPGQQENCGPYCYQGNIERVQFWRHCSVLNNAPVITNTVIPSDTFVAGRTTSYSSQQYAGNNTPNTVNRLASATKERTGVLKQDDARKSEFESMVNAMATDAPQMGREIIITSELYNSNILKGSQESRKERV